jgi:hypothetical protein
MQGWSDWSGAGAKLASQAGVRLPNSCAGGTVPILGARHEHKCRLGEAGLLLCAAKRRCQFVFFREAAIFSFHA